MDSLRLKVWSIVSSEGEARGLCYGSWVIEAENLESWNFKSWRLGWGNLGPGNMDPEGLEYCIFKRRRMVPGCPWTGLLQGHWCAEHSIFSPQAVGAMARAS
jgi:hypothetical protein